MSRQCIAIKAGLIILVLLRVSFAEAQNYPTRTIRIVTGETGGNSDFASRLISQGLTSRLQQQVIVDNRGGSAIIAVQAVTQSPPDGYTLLLHSSNVWLLPYLQDNVPYDPIKDLSPVTITASAPAVLVVNSAVGAESVKDLVALAKSKPGELNYSSAQTGSASHLAAELFCAMAHVNIVRVSYKGTAPALNALIGGQVQVLFSTAPPVKPHVQSGRLRALAITSAQPSSLFAGLPTVAASGFPGYEFTTILAIFAPRATPGPVVSLLAKEVTQVLSNADVKQKFLNSGVEVVESSPEQLATLIKADMAKMGKVIKDANIRAE